MGGEGQEAGLWTVPDKKLQECQLLPPLTHLGLTQLLPACGVLGEAHGFRGFPRAEERKISCRDIEGEESRERQKRRESERARGQTQPDSGEIREGHRDATYTLKYGFSGGSVVKNPADAGDAGSVPGSGRSPGEVNSNPLQYSCLENSMDRGAWRAIQSMVSQRSQTLLSH